MVASVHCSSAELKWLIRLLLSNLLAADIVYALLPTENLLAPPGFILLASRGKLSALFNKPDANIYHEFLQYCHLSLASSFPVLGPPWLLDPDLLSSPGFLLLALRGELPMTSFFFMNLIP